MDDKIKKYEIYIEESEVNVLGLTNKVIAILFKEFREKSEYNNEMSLTEKKDLLNRFERVIKCTRREILGIEELYKNQEDNIEVLIELSEVLNLKSEFDNLFELYRGFFEENIKINVIYNGDNKKLEEEKNRNIPNEIQIEFTKEGWGKLL